MKTLSLKAKLINCFFALTLVTGLCVPSLASYAYADPVMGAVTQENPAQAEDALDEGKVADTTETGTGVDGKKENGSEKADLTQNGTNPENVGEKSGEESVAEIQSEQIVPLATEVTDWADVAGSDFQVKSAGAGSISVGTTAGDGSDCYFEGTILHIQSSKPIAVKNKNEAVATANTIQIDPGVQADLTLAGVNISTATTSPINMITNSDEDGDGVKVTNAADIANKTKLYLTLADGSPNNNYLTNTAGSDGWPAIRCGWGSVLVIDDAIRNLDASNKIITPQDGMIASDVTLVDGTTLNAGDPLTKLDSPAGVRGKLIAQGGAHAACIGSASKENAGTLIINGGDITAHVFGFNGNNWGLASGSGIGGGPGGSGTIITINGGKIATYGSSCGTGIGAGFGYFTTSDHHAGKAKLDAIEVPKGEENSHGYSWYGAVTDGGPNIQYPSYEHYHTVAGDIAINGGYIYAEAAHHGNAVGQCCAHGPASNKNHVIKITGGTLITKVPNKGSKDPYLYGIGARNGYTIVTGGSVFVEDGTVGSYDGKPLFQGLGNTAYNTQGVTDWSDVTNQFGGVLPDKDKVQMITIDLSSEFKAGENKTVPIVKWQLEIENKVQHYGSPSYLNDGKLYLWVPEDATGKNVTVTLSYKDDAGKIHNIEPMYVEEVGGEQGSLLKRYIDINIEKLSDEQKKYFSSLTKEYDGLPFEAFDIANNPIDTAPFEANGKILDRPEDVTISYQAYDAINGSPLPGSTVETTGFMPANTGTFRVQLVSKQHAKGDFGKSYWGHRITGWAQVTPEPAVVKLKEVQWGNLNANGDWDVIDETDTDAGNRIKVTFDIRSQVGTALTCGIPTGQFQLMVDNVPVGDPIDLTQEAITPADGSKSENTFRTQESKFKKEHNVADKMNSFEYEYVDGRARVEVTYFFDPTKTDGLLAALDKAAEANYASALAEGNSEEEAADKANKHQISVLYIPDKNYIEGVENNEANKDDGHTVIIPVDPSTDIKIDGPVAEDKPKDDPVTPPEQTDGVDVLQKAFIAKYSDYHSKDDPTKQDFFKVDMGTKSAMPIECYSTNPAVVDLVKDEAGNPVFDEDGKIQVKVNSCGVGVIVMKQKGNPLYRGQIKELTVTVIPDAKISPKTEVRVLWNNKTHPGLPAAPGDEIEYTLVGTNLTPGSAWQNVDLLDVLSPNVTVDRSSFEIVQNLDVEKAKIVENGVETIDPAVVEELIKDKDKVKFNSLDSSKVTISKDKDGKEKLTTNVDQIFGNQSTVIKFKVKVKDSLADRESITGENPPTIPNTPGAYGTFGVKDDRELAEGELKGDPKELEEATKVYPIESDEIPEAVVIPKDPKLPDEPSGDNRSDISVVKTAKNLTHPEGGKALVGDVIEYTITLGNKGKDTCYYWPAIVDNLPKGLKPVPGSFELTKVDGKTKVEVPDSAYQKATHTIAVYVDDLYGGEETTLTFKCTVEPEATDIANTAQAIGTKPSDKWKEEQNDPTPPTPNPDELPDTPDPDKGDPDPGDKTKLAYISFSANGGHYVPHASTQADYGSIIIRTDGSPATISGLPGSKLDEYHHAVFPTEENNPVMDGYDFVEWNTKRDGTGEKVTKYPTNFADTAGTTYYYAKWKKSATNNDPNDPEIPDPGKDEDDPADLTQHAHIVFAANGGQDAPDGIAGEPGTKITDPFPEITPHAAGYTFVGWNTKPDGTGETVTTFPQNFADSAGTTTYYAQWKKNPAPTWPPTPGQPWSPDRDIPADEYPWDDPDAPFDWDEYFGDEPKIETPEPADVGKVMPADPDYKDLRITLSAKNEARTDGNTYVGDEVTYTILIENLSSPEKSWLDVIARADIPEGLKFMPGSIYLTTPAGEVIHVDDAAYNDLTRILALNVGDLAGGESAKVVFKAEVTLDALNKDIGMTSKAYGTLPSEFDVEDESYVKPEPGSAFVPAEGWNLYDLNHKSISNPEKVYPSENVTEQKPPLPNTQEEVEQAKKLAKTGDTLGYIALGVGVIAVAAVITLLVALRRIRKDK